jgi:hypothetical protein
MTTASAVDGRPELAPTTGQSAATRPKMSATHKRRRTRPPWLNKPWEDQLCRTLPPAEAVKQMGRTTEAACLQRRDLGLLDGRSRKEPRKSGRST